MHVRVTPDTNAAIPATKWRWLRISLRTTLVLLTLFCLWLGWYCSLAQKQRRAVAWLQERGCLVGYDSDFNADGDLDRDTKSVPTEWLIKALGPDFFHSVVAVRFEQPLMIDESVMDRLRELPRLRQLEGRRCPLAPGIERRFAELSRLEDLELEVCSLNDEQLAALGKLTNLRVLNLQHNPFRGTGLAAWDRLDRLETLYLSDTEVTDDNLVHLAELENLQSLYLGDTGLGDPGLAHVAKISTLRHLSIDDLYSHRKSRYTDQGVSHLKVLRNLERLDIEEF